MLLIRILDFLYLQRLGYLFYSDFASIVILHHKFVSTIISLSLLMMDDVSPALKDWESCYSIMMQQIISFLIALSYYLSTVGDNLASLAGGSRYGRAMHEVRGSYYDMIVGWLWQLHNIASSYIP